jgi:hypothetical protein
LQNPERSLTLRSPRRNISFTNFALIESVFEERENEERKVFCDEKEEKIVRQDESWSEFLLFRRGVYDCEREQTKFFNTIKINDISLN